MKKIYSVLSLVLLTTASAQAAVWCGYNAPGEESAVIIHNGDRSEAITFGKYDSDRNEAIYVCGNALASTQCELKHEDATPSFVEDHGLVFGTEARDVFVTPAKPGMIHNNLNDCQATEAKVATLNARSQQRAARKVQQAKESNVSFYGQKI